MGYGYFVQIRNDYQFELERIIQEQQKEIKSLKLELKERENEG